MLEQVARETNQKVVNQKSQIQTFYASLHAAIDLTIRISLTRPIAVLPQLWLFPTLGNIRGREPHHQQPWLYCLWGSFHPYGRLCFLEYACLPWFAGLPQILDVAWKEQCCPRSPGWLGPGTAAQYFLYNGLLYDHAGVLEWYRTFQTKVWLFRESSVVSSMSALVISASSLTLQWCMWCWS